MLAGILASISVESLSGHDQVLLLQAERRQAAHYEARAYATMVSVAESTAEELPDEPPELVEDVAASEIRAALTLTHRSAGTQLDFATTLVSDYPRVWEMLDQGLIDVPKAMVIVNQTCHLESDHREAVVAAALERASSQTTGQLRARLARLVISIDPDSARKRYEQGVEERKVTTEVNDDGTANLYAFQLPTRSKPRLSCGGSTVSPGPPATPKTRGPSTRSVPTSSWTCSMGGRPEPGPIGERWRSQWTWPP